MQGVGGDAARAALAAVHIWRETSGVCFLELLTNQGRYASHFSGAYEGGIAGWHTVASGIIAYGSHDESNHRLQLAMLDNMVMERLSASIGPLLDRDRPNGIKFLLSVGTEGSLTAEVRVNDNADPGASQQLAEMPWPRLERVAIARCFAVALHSLS